jgi:signal peptidase II
MEQAQARPTAPERTAPPGYRLGPALAIASVIVAADQVTKALVRARLAEGEVWPNRDALLAISHVENSGAAFGMFQDAGTWLLALTVIGVAAVFVYLWRFPPRNGLYLVALSLILGGAVGNLIDRATKGTVTDFIDPTHYPAFNVADSSIVVGICAIVLLSFIEDRHDRAT